MSEEQALDFPLSPKTLATVMRSLCACIDAAGEALKEEGKLTTDEEKSAARGVRSSCQAAVAEIGTGMVAKTLQLSEEFRGPALELLKGLFRKQFGMDVTVTELGIKPTQEGKPEGVTAH